MGLPLIAGIAVAAIWLLAADRAVLFSVLARARPVPVAAMLAAIVFWLSVRFIRWQYLMRRAGVRVPIRGSAAAYLAGLPGTATPAYVGEIIRGVFIRWRYGVPLRLTTSVLIAERLLDLLALGLILAASTTSVRNVAFVLAAVMVLTVGIWALTRTARADGTSEQGRYLAAHINTLAIMLLLSLAAWTAAGSLVLLASAAIGVPVPFGLSLRAFSTAMLGGALSLMPAGLGTVGSLLILELRAFGQTLTDAIATTLLVRLASVGVTMSIGTAFLVGELRWRRKATATDARRHFEEIAEEYRHQFSDHVWQHLLGRKLEMIESAIARKPKGTELILDLGCGLGTQAAAMIERGYHVVGIDVAEGLLRHARASGVPVISGDALGLPFADATFGQIYAIGVLHHLNGEEAQRAAFTEIARVLKSGGLFLIHESNPRNPLFRFYFGYVFPLLKTIDEGTESWIHPRTLDHIAGLTLVQLRYFTFLPDFIPPYLMRSLLALQRWLEASALNPYSVHYFAVLEKGRDATLPDQSDSAGALSEAAALRV